MDVQRAAEPADAPSEESGVPDSIRITRHGKLRVWVKKALDFFEVRSIARETATYPTLVQSHPDKPLVLYSAPADVSTSTIARLVSVVEIIKREYLKGRDVSGGDASGLHQCNELLSEQQDRIPMEGEERRDALRDALEGHSQCVKPSCCRVVDPNSRSVKQTFVPHMKITLSTTAIPRTDKQRAT